MSFGAPAPQHLQPRDFAFTAENLERAQKIIAKYPPGKQQSAVMPLLDLAQRQNENWLPRVAMDYVADLLEMPRIRAYEVASFYTMYNKAPVGKFLVQVCTTTPCWLCNSDAVLKALKDKTGAAPGHDSEDGMFTVVEVECLGACVNAPMVQINDDYVEDLDYDRTCALIDDLKAGKALKKGSVIGRPGSQAEAGPTTLAEWAPGKKGQKRAAKTAEGAEVDNGQVADAAKGAEGSSRSDADPEKKARTKVKVRPEGKTTGAKKGQ